MHPEEQLSAYLDGELGHEEQVQIETHLENCSSCQSLLLELTDLKQTFSSAIYELAEPDDLETRVMQAVARETSIRNLGKLWIFVPLLSVMVFVLLVITAGPIVIPLMQGVLVIGRALLYTVSHAVADMPMLSGIVVILSLIVLFASVLSIRKVLRSTAM
ncbi:anti-sigma factor family protein [Paenibacillus sp. NPDC056933]|uniref:anti-sigma factor family protein n=1 Tax=Paenibacillus sp. NPDC056933 TaxID=3345968 RepID=UPI00362D0D8F